MPFKNIPNKRTLNKNICKIRASLPFLPVPSFFFRGLSRDIRSGRGRAGTGGTGGGGAGRGLPGRSAGFLGGNIWKTYGKTWKIIIYIILHIELISKYGNIILILYRNNNIISKYGKQIWKDDSFPRIGRNLLG
jgi:hypothetical protein